MTTIDNGIGGPAGGAATGPVPGESVASPGVALRLVTTYDGATRRIDVAIGAGTSTAVENGVATEFATEQLWPELRDRLPPLTHLRADPRGRPAPEPRDPGPGFAESCLAHVVLATVVSDGTTLGGDLADDLGPQASGVVAIRTWLATEDELWEVTPVNGTGTQIRPAADGALGDLLIWDVTGALQHLLTRADTQDETAQDETAHDETAHDETAQDETAHDETGGDPS